MKASFRSAGRNFPVGEIFWKPGPAGLALVLLLFIAVLPLRAVEATDALEIQSVG